MDLEGREGWDLRFKTIHFNIPAKCLIGCVCDWGTPSTPKKRQHTQSDFAFEQRIDRSAQIKRWEHAGFDETRAAAFPESLHLIVLGPRVEPRRARQLAGMAKGSNNSQLTHSQNDALLLLLMLRKASHFVGPIGN